MCAQSACIEHLGLDNHMFLTALVIWREVSVMWRTEERGQRRDGGNRWIAIAFLDPRVLGGKLRWETPIRTEG